VLSKIKKKVFMKLKLLVFSLLLLFSCTEKKDEIVPEIYHPMDFKVELSSCDYFSASILWSESKIEDDSRIRYDIFLDDVLVNENLDVLVFAFKELKETTVYNVKVVAKSEYETTKTIPFTFTTKTTPSPKSFEIKAESVSAEEIDIAWSAGEEGEGLIYSVYLNDVLKVSDLETNAFKYTGLKPLTKYAIKVVATNVYDKTVEMSMDVETVDFDSPADFVLQVQDLNPNRATVYWSDEYDSELTYQISLDGKLVADEYQNSFYQFIDLKENTTYTVVVVAQNTHGKSISHEISFTTGLEDRPSDFKIDVSNITRETALITWSAMGDNNGAISYDLFVNGSYKAKEFGDNSLEVTMLEPNTSYRVKIVATNYKENTITKEIVFTTLAVPTLSEMLPTVGTQTGSTAVISWNASVSSDGQQVEYSVFSLNSNGNRWYQIKSKLSDTKWKVEYLRPNTLYKYKLVAYALDHSVSKEEFVNFTTPEAASPSDFEINVSQDDITSNSAVVVWTDSELGKGVDYEDYIRYELICNGETHTFGEDGSHEYKLSGLTPDTDYGVVVKAVSSHGMINVQKKSFRTKAEKVYTLSFYARVFSPRSLSFDWSFENRPDVRYYDFYFGDRNLKRIYPGMPLEVTVGTVNSGVRLISNTEYTFKIVAVTDREERIEKEIRAKTSSYTEVQDFEIGIDADIYSVVSIDLLNFVEAYIGNIEDIQKMYTEYYLDGLKLRTARFQEGIDVTSLKPESKYSLRVRILYPDETEAFEKTVEFTTGKNTAPKWNADIELLSVKSNVIELSSVFAEDNETGVTYQYYINGRMWTGGVAVAGNVVGLPQVDVRVNTEGKPIVMSHFDYETDYQVYIVAKDKEGVETKTNTLHFKTGAE